MFLDKKEMEIRKREGPQHPPPIAGFSSICNLITKDNITDMIRKVNQKLSLLYTMSKSEDFMHIFFRKVR